MTYIKLLLSLTILGLYGCIGDDFVDDFVEPEIRSNQVPSSIAVGDSFQIEATFLDNVGKPVQVPLLYISEDETIFTVDNNGLILAHSEGNAQLTISVEFEESTYTTMVPISVAAVTVIEPESKNGTIATTSSYELSGSFTMTKTSTGIVINIAEDWTASTALPGLYIYLTNNKNTSTGALEIGPVTVFEGEHAYEVANVGLNDFSHILYFCKPFSVKVGDGEIR